jgi:hypothetical protein
MKLDALYLTLTILPTLSSSCLLPEERDGRPRTLVRLSRRQSNGLSIGTGDRFSAGSIAPRGVGTQSTTLTSILNVKEISSGIKGLASVYGISTFNTPNPTFNGATVVGGKVGGNSTCNGAYRVYLNAGIHARERGGPDGLLYFVSPITHSLDRRFIMFSKLHILTNFHSDWRLALCQQEQPWLDLWIKIIH